MWVWFCVVPRPCVWVWFLTFLALGLVPVASCRPRRFRAFGFTYHFTMSQDPKIQLPDYRRSRRGRDFPAAASIFGSFCEICANSVRC